MAQKQLQRGWDLQVPSPYYFKGCFEFNDALCRVRAVPEDQLFFGSDSGGERAAAFCAVIGTVKLNGLDPVFYIRTILARIVEQPHSCRCFLEGVDWRRVERTLTPEVAA